mgnify:CR=1 FL=1
MYYQKLFKLNREIIKVVEQVFDSEIFHPQKNITISNNDNLSLILSGALYPGLRDHQPLFAALDELSNENNVNLTYYGNSLKPDSYTVDYIKVNPKVNQAQLASAYRVIKPVSVAKVMEHIQSEVPIILDIGEPLNTKGRTKKSMINEKK